ncbi:MAG: pilus assembly protein PilM [Candidatus Colwellbacteria bacterium]
MKFLNSNFSAKGGSASGGQFSKLLKKIYPEPPIAGLEISDSAIHLAEFKGGSPTIRANLLPPGIVEGGRVKNKAKLVSLLRELVGASYGSRKPGFVLTIPSSDVFIQTVNLPAIALRNLDEAAELNVRMVSPLRQGEFYSDWQRVRRDEAEGGPIELLGVFVSRETVDGFSDCFREADLSLVAIEFTSLSLVRLLASKKFTQPMKPYLVAEIRPEGTTFMLIFNNQLLFHSFHGWGGAIREGGTVMLADFLADLTEEIGNISNFYLAHWGGVVSDLIFVSSGLEKEIEGAFKDRSLKLLKAEEMTPALGAATRLILGGKEINLFGTSSLEIFRLNRALVFVTLWRTALATTLGFLLLLALGSDLFLRQLAKIEVNTLTLNEPGRQELLALKGEAAKFNELVSLVRGARQGKPQIGQAAELVSSSAGVGIRITRFYVTSIDAPITVSGVASNEQEAIAFKNRLAKEKSITSVDMPISSILPETDGRVSFTLRFQVLKPDFPE